MKVRKLETKQVKLSLEAIDVAPWREKLPSGVEVLCFKGWANTEEEDSYGDVILASAWVDGLEQFTKNGPLLYMHKADEQIGAVIDLRVVEGKGLYIERAEITISPATEHIVRMIEAGHMRGLSVGVLFIEYYPKDHKDPLSGYIVTRAELRELSVVSMPANLPSLIGSNKAMCEFIDGLTTRMTGVLPYTEQPDIIKDETQDTHGVQEEPMAKVFDLSDATMAVVKRGLDIVNVPAFRDKLYAYAPDLNSGTVLEKHFQLPLTDEDGKFDDSQLKCAMGMLYTKRSGVPDESIGEVFERLKTLYGFRGLEAPEMSPAEVSFKDVEFKHDEAALVSLQVLTTNTKAVKDGVTHILKAGYTIPAEVARELAWVWIDIYKSGYVDDSDVTDLLSMLNKPKVDDEDEDESTLSDDSTLQEKAEDGKLDMSGLDQEEIEILKQMGIDPDAPDAASKLDELLTALSSS